MPIVGLLGKPVQTNNFYMQFHNPDKQNYTKYLKNIVDLDKRLHNQDNLLHTMDWLYIVAYDTLECNQYIVDYTMDLPNIVD